jgi:hypothetical protein
MQSILTPLARRGSIVGKRGLALRRPTICIRVLIDLDWHAGSNVCGSLVFLVLLPG